MLEPTINLSDDIRIMIVTAGDRNYFPFVKGLFLSLVESGQIPRSIDLACFDLGFDPASTEWLQRHGIQLISIDQAELGELNHQKYGYRRAQTCRPYLPLLFPGIDVFVWMDGDTWVQDVANFLKIILAASQKPDDIFISQEVHTGYIWDGYTAAERIAEMREYYSPLYDQKISDSLSQKVTYNSGIFFMSRLNPIWNVWRSEINRIYIDEFAKHDGRWYFHFSEQIALNYTLDMLKNISLFDPNFNYICIWNPPRRSNDGVVRSTIAPYLPIGVVHLALWRKRSKIYIENELLYRSGSYLTGSERQLLGLS